MAIKLPFLEDKLDNFMKLNISSYLNPKKFAQKKIENKNPVLISNKPHQTQNKKVYEKKEVVLLQKHLLTNFDLKKHKKKRKKNIVKNQNFYGLPLIKSKQFLNFFNFYK